MVAWPVASTWRKDGYAVFTDGFTVKRSLGMVRRTILHWRSMAPWRVELIGAQWCLNDGGQWWGAQQLWWHQHNR
jgi:hypothetical protein